MRHFLKKMIPMLLVIFILVSAAWYFLIFDTTLTRDLLLQQARRFEDNGNTSGAVWLYNLAYLQSGNDEAVAIELSEQFKAIGNYSKAESTLTKAIKDGGGVNVYIALCKTYLEQDKVLDAVTMLDKVANTQIKAELDALRPSAPEASLPSGSYSQYHSITFSAEGGQICITADQTYPSSQNNTYSDPITLPRGQSTLCAVTIGDNGLVSRLAVYSYIVSNVVEEVTFADSSMEATIRQLLQLPDDEAIYSNMLWDIDTFTMPQDAGSCTDLQWLPYLKTLTIEDCAFSDFSPLASLSNLQCLIVKNTTIADSDLSFLTGMKELSQLTLSGCSISTIADMKGIKSLQELDLSNNTVRNLSALADMTSLTKLDLSYNAVISLQDIQGLTSLQHLDLAYNSLATTAPVAALTELTYLDVSSNNLMQVDMKGLDALAKLEHFSAAYNNLTDLSILKNCVMLKTLDVSHNTLLNILAIANLSLLEELDFSHNEVSRLPEFKSNCALRIIRGEYNLLTSLDNLSGLENLTHIYMDYNVKLSNINALRHCKKLNTVNVFGTKVTDISALADAGILVNYSPKT